MNKEPKEIEKIKILIVDDSDIIRHSLKLFFADYSFEVITCLDGLEGIQKAIEHKPCLIFLDLMMPNFDGMKMLQVLRVLEDLKNVPVIVISANTDKKNVLAAIEAGANRVISKPLQRELIIKYVNEILGADFLSRAKHSKVFNDSDKNEINNQLIKFFVQSFEIKRLGILQSIESKNKDLLKAIVHEIAGTGATIGYPRLSELSNDIFMRLGAVDIDWNTIRLRCEQLFSIANEIESLDSAKGI
jgi:DNA-binding response OmpR family regulator